MTSGIPAPLTRLVASRIKSVSSIFWFGTLFFILMGQFWPESDKFVKLAKADPTEAFTLGSAFVPNGVYTSTPPLPANYELKTYGSWVQTDATTGQMATPWYKAASRFGIFIAGYPNTLGNKLEVEVQYKNGTSRVMPVTLADSAEVWLFRIVRLTDMSGAKRMRLVATDGSAVARGWLGFSDPVESPYAVVIGAQHVLRTILALLASITFLFGPGLVMKAVMESVGRPVSFVFVPLPGAALMALWGFFTWVVRIGRAPDHLYLFSYLLLAALVGCSVKWNPEASLSAAERKVLLFCFLAILVAAGKGLYSLGPTGELYENKISRTNEVGDRPDSRVSYHLVQVVANGLRLASQPARDLFAQQAFTSGPVAGLAAAPVVLISGADVPRVEADQPWRPYDIQGFSVYRIFMVCLAAGCLLAFFGLAKAISQSDTMSLAGIALLALSPFFVHEIYFTWPKLFASTIILTAFYCAYYRKFKAAGATLGAAYLIHPLALLSLAPLACLMVAVEIKRLLGDESWTAISPERKMQIGKSAVIVAVAPALIFGLVWEVWNKLAAGPVQSSVFSSAVSISGAVGHSFRSWIADRLLSLANTLVPFFLFLISFDDPSINSTTGPSPIIVQFYFSYWNTLPFACGIVFFLPFLRWITSVARRYKGEFLTFVVLPLAVFAICWGGNHSGLMREGLQPWFLMIFVFLVWGLVKAPDLRAGFLSSCAKLQNWRLVELLGMLIIPTFFTRWRLINTDYLITDLAAMTAMLAGTFLIAREGQKLLVSALPETNR